MRRYREIDGEILKMNVGDKFEISFDVDRRMHRGFIELFKDGNPLHTNREFAVSKGFEGEVMHGNILNGFLSYFIGECLPSKDVIIHKQEIKFAKPVYLDDRVTLNAEVAELYESVGVVLFSFVFKNQNGVKVAQGKIQIGKI